MRTTFLNFPIINFGKVYLYIFRLGYYEAEKLDLFFYSDIDVNMLSSYTPYYDPSNTVTTTQFYHSQNQSGNDK